MIRNWDSLWSWRRARQRVFSLLGLLVIPGLAPAQAERLSKAARDSVDRGELVMTQEPRAEAPWPAVTAWAFIAATPEEAIAVFTDYESHAGFIPSLKKARISRVVDRATTEVDYTLSVPIVSDEDYTVRNRVSKAGAVYRVDWTLVRASSTKATVGHAVFVPYTNAHTGAAGTLLEYHNFVTPGSRMAGMGFVRNRSIQQVLETTGAVARRIEAVRAKPEAIEPRLRALRTALAL